jgi:hypothetical protein
MKISIYKICLLSMLLLSLNVGCKKSVQKEEPLVGGDLAVRLLGNLVPSSVAIDKNSMATVSFIGSDQSYNFDLSKEIYANSYWGRLVNAQKNATSVKVYITNQTK